MTPSRGLLNRSHTRCEPCRRWHGKCDATRPSCSTCVSYQRTCLYAGHASTDIRPGVAGSQFLRQSTDLECRLVVVAGVLATLRRVLWTDTADAYARRREAAGGNDGEMDGEEGVVGRDSDGDGSDEDEEEEDDDDDDEYHPDGGDDYHERQGNQEATDDDENRRADDEDLDDDLQDTQTVAGSVENLDHREGPAEVSGQRTQGGEEIDDIFLQNLDPALRPT